MFKVVLTCLFSFILLSFTTTLLAQKPRLNQDPKLNNLVHPVGYKTGKLGELGRVRKVGEGSQDMILIAGLGFGDEIWNGFMESKKKQYTMYAVTLPGFSGTPAPPMPNTGTSYGERTWTKAAQKGIENLIKEKKLKKPIVVGHWQIASEIAMNIALEKPELISKVILISGVAKNVMADAQFKKTLTVKERATYIDRGMAPRWFKTVTRDTWDDNNWFPYEYAVHPLRALQLWRIAYDVTLPVHVRYLCEHWTQDLTVNLKSLKVPTLLVKPGYSKEFDNIVGQRGAVRQLTIDSWKDVEKMSSLITTKSIENSRIFIMDDQPKKLDEAISSFLSK